MKTWMFWVILAVFILVVIPFLYFAVVAKNVAKVAASDNFIEPIPGVSGTGINLQGY